MADDHSRTIEWESLVAHINDKDLREPEPVYEWSNGREDKSTDATNTGIYDGT